MKFNYNLTLLIILLITVSCGNVLAGGVGPPPSPMSVPLDGGISAVLLAAGAYIGYKALKGKENK